jgi:LacI family transcriptional regulator
MDFHRPGYGFSLCYPCLAMVTMLDIARDLNVSVVTVSKVLRNQGKISEATRRRVLQRARELNYQANWIARSLVTRRTLTIGLLLPDFTHPFFAEIAKAVADTIRPRGYHVIISYFEEDPSLEQTEVDALIARQVDGLIVASAQPSGKAGLFARIRERKIPFVLIDRPLAGTGASFVGVDHRELGRIATQHLIEQGCRRIAHLRGPRVGIAAARLAGYRDALARHGILSPEHFVIDANFEDSTGSEAMRTLLRTRPLPDGIFCYNDPVAIGAMKTLFEAGLRVPQDIAVVGAGNVHYSDVLAVPLTTVDQQTLATGKRSAELLLEQIGSERPLRPQKILIPPRLVVRQSSNRSGSIPVR